MKLSVSACNGHRQVSITINRYRNLTMAIVGLNM